MEKIELKIKIHDKQQELNKFETANHQILLKREILQQELDDLIEEDLNS